MGGCAIQCLFSCKSVVGFDCVKCLLRLTAAPQVAAWNRCWASRCVNRRQTLMGAGGTAITRAVPNKFSGWEWHRCTVAPLCRAGTEQRRRKFWADWNAVAGDSANIRFKLRSLGAFIIKIRMSSLRRRCIKRCRFKTPHIVAFNEQTGSGHRSTPA